MILGLYTFPPSNVINHLAVQVTVFAVGVTSGVNEEELETIASDPKCNNVHLLESFSDITSFSNLIMKSACQGETHLRYSLPLGRLKNGATELQFHCLHF